MSGIYESKSIENIVRTAKEYARSFMQAKSEAETKKKELLTGLPDFDDVYPSLEATGSDDPEGFAEYREVSR